MTRGTSTTTEWISAWSDLMDAGSNDCALATVVVQTIPPMMNQSGSSARFMRVDYSHRHQVGVVWLESVGDVQVHLLGTAEPGASEAEARADSQNLGIGPVRRHGYQRGCAFNASISLAAWSRNALRRPCRARATKPNARRPYCNCARFGKSSAPKKRHGVLDRARDLLRDDYGSRGGCAHCAFSSGTKRPLPRF